MRICFVSLVFVSLLTGLSVVTQPWKVLPEAAFMELDPEGEEPEWPEGQSYEARVKSVSRIWSSVGRIVVDQVIL